VSEAYTQVLSSSTCFRCTPQPQQLPCSHQQQQQLHVLNSLVPCAACAARHGCVDSCAQHMR
jgi:hypothetical protein